MNEKKICPVCKKETDANMIDICNSAYKYVMERIKARHPEWLEKDGACPKCVEYYKKI